MAKTLLQMRTEVRARCDQPGIGETGFVKDSELNININSSLAELHDILIEAWGEDYYLKSYDFVTAGNEDSYDLPPDFYKLKGVDYVDGIGVGDNNAICLRPFTFNERNNYNDLYHTTVYGDLTYKYRLVGSKLTLIPLPRSLDTLRLWYHPKSVTLALDTDSFDGINGYEEYVIIDNCIKIMIKEEQDPTAFYQQKQDLKMRIVDAAANRQSPATDVVTDIYNTNDFYYF